KEVPITVGSTRGFETDMIFTESTGIDAKLETARPGQLSGTISHKLAWPIEDWILAFEHLVYRPVDDPKTGKPIALAPGVAWSPRNASQRELSGFLTGTTQRYVSHKTKGEELKIEQVAYDPFQPDVGVIARVLTFHSIAGGRSYTGLRNGPLRAADLSPLLGLNRAVLIGRVRTK